MSRRTYNKAEGVIDLLERLGNGLKDGQHELTQFQKVLGGVENSVGPFLSSFPGPCLHGHRPSILGIP